MTVDRIILSKGPESGFVIVLADTGSAAPVKQTFGPASKEEATAVLRDLKLPETEIECLFAKAEGETGPTEPCRFSIR